jgi:acyl-CoA thioester hydrolase
MPRITLELPPKFLFSTDLTVRATDLNYGGHVGNDTILSYMQEIRVQFYRQLGFKSELNIEGSVGQIITDAVVVYKSESFLGDIITGSIAPIDFNKYGFDYVYLLTNKLTGKEVARGKTGIVCFNYDKRKVVSAPTKLLDALQRE